jgi:hypothetical protein
MGIEVKLSAFPPQCELLERVRAGEICAQDIQFVWWYFFNRRTSATRWNGFARGDPERERFVDLLEMILAQHPGIAEIFRYMWFAPSGRAAIFRLRLSGVLSSGTVRL